MNKKLLLVIALLLCGADVKKKSDPDIEILTGGLVCSFCGVGIRKHFGKLDSVEEVKLDDKNHITYLFLKNNKPLTDKLIHATMKKAGYKALKIKRNDVGKP